MQLNAAQRRRLMQLAKAQPTPGDVHINAPLTDISVATMLDQQLFVAADVFPQVPVQNKSDLYYIFTQGDFLRNAARVRAPGTESAGSGFTLTTDTYSCLPKSLHKDIDDQLRANADSVLQLDRAATLWLTQQMLIARETDWASAFWATGKWGTDIVGQASGAVHGSGQFNQWDQYGAGASNPASDVDYAKGLILKATGKVANTGVVDYLTFLALRDNPTVKDQFKYTSAASIDAAMMARYFGLDRLLIMGGISVTALEGATQTPGFIGGKNMLVCYTPNAPSLMEEAAGYTFTWAGLTGAGSTGIQIKKFRVERLQSDRVEANMAYAQKIVSAGCGVFLSGTIA